MAILRGVQNDRDLILARTRTELAAALTDAGPAAAVVMTMGALHEGHAALIRAARDRVGRDGRVTVTIFVNPLQFGAGEDFDRYPRVFDSDLALCQAEGADVVFAPARDEMYPGGEPQVTIHPGPLATELEGAVRPTHFAGVLTVVAKLLNLTSPTYAIFGEKDYQQLILIRRMVADLELPGEIVGVPTVREPDGLALSSRNRYLTTAERTQALALSKALDAGAAAADAGADPAGVLAAAYAELRGPSRQFEGKSAPQAPTSTAKPAGISLDYLELRDPELGPPPPAGEARLLVAARVGSTRLIDNRAIKL
jgi:pantoate--beta-alanine ligase